MRLVVFDVDGTLVDSAATIVSRVTRAFADTGERVPSEAQIRANVGLSLAVFMGRLLGTADAARIDRLVAAYRAIGDAEPEGSMPLFAGSRAVLESLSRDENTLLGIATGKGRRGLDKVLAQNDIAQFFRTLQTPDTNPSKPHPGMLIAAMRECRTGPDQTVMIGDAGFDMEMAHAAGTRSIAVAWGMQSFADLMALEPHAGAESMDRLEAAIDAVFGVADA